MNISLLRIRPISFKDEKGQILNDTLFYVKKLRETQPNPDSPVILEQNDRSSSVVLSSNETFEWHIDEGNHCQVLFLSAEARAKPRGDIFLWFNHLINMLHDRHYFEQSEPELLCDAPLERDYLFEFAIHVPSPTMSLVPYVPPTKKTLSMNKVSRRQPVRGHLMKLKQFNQPVYCALCNEFIWGLRHQGYECTRCSLVTDKKCYRLIPFWCQQSPYPEPISTQPSGKIKFHMTHMFKSHDAPLIRSIFTRDVGHCSHCGSKILIKALKCTQCHFIIHEHCKSNVPPMCTINYRKLADALGNEAVDLGAIGLVRMHSAAETESELVIHPMDDNQSESPSADLTWIDPPLVQTLNDPETGRCLLPSFGDFLLYGRIGNGAYAKVYCVQHIRSKQYLAIKVANDSLADARHQLETEREILFRHGDKNPFIVKAYCSFHHANRLFLVMELVNGGTLYNKILTTRMNEDEIRFYLAEIVCVLQYLHSNNIVYRDLKLEHAIVSSEGHIRLVDYGLGRFLRTSDEKCFTYCGTTYYMAPEVRRVATMRDRSDGYSFPVDFWALGIMLVQMLFGEQLDFLPLVISNFTENPTKGTSIVDKLELPKHTSAVAKRCVADLLEIDPEKRLGSPNSPHGPIRDHPFFKWNNTAWREIEDGVFKPCYKAPIPTKSPSETSIDPAISALSSVRSNLVAEEWNEMGRATCSTAEDNDLRSFDYVNIPQWLPLVKES